MNYRVLIPVSIATLLLVSTVSAITWTAGTGCWTATDGSASLVMWNTTGSFVWTVPAGVSSVDYFVLAGGGAGGGSHYGSGGGAGGLLNGTGLAVTPLGIISGYVGPGGLGTTVDTYGGNGTFSLFGSINATGGGGGGSATYANGRSGGSGAGAKSGGTPGTGIAGQGHDGGTADGTSPYFGGGGGGYGSAGGIGGGAPGLGLGGSGAWSNITGTPAWYACGGGGHGNSTNSNGGCGGIGGNGSWAGNGNDAVAGTGSGGGGPGTNPGYHSGNGSAGFVVVKYTTPSGAANPIVSFTSNVTSGTTPLSVLFNDTSITTPTAWNWSFTNTTPGNNTQIWWSQIQNATQSFGVGNWNINLNVTNSSGYNVSTSYYWVNVSQPTPPVASFTKDKTGGAVPLIVTFTDTSTNSPTSWFWVFGDGSTENNTVKNPVHTFTGAGTYNVNLTVTNVYGSSTSGTQAITTGTVPVASFTANTSFGAPPLGVQFNDTSTDTVAMSAWNWSFQNVTGNNTQVWFSTTQNATHSFGVGNYKIALNATNTYGTNISTQTTWVNVTTLQADFTGTPTTGLPGTNVAFTESTTGFNTDSRTWDFGDGNTSTSANPSHVYAYSGAFTVNLTAYNASAGFSSKVRTGYIVINPSGGLSGFNRQDIILSGLYTLTLTIKDSATHAPIPVCQIIDSNGDNTTTSVGVATFSYNYSVVVEYISSTGYNSMSVSYVMDRDRSETVYLTKTAEIPNSTPFAVTYPPKDIGFHVQTLGGNVLPLTFVTATPIQTTLGNYADLATLFGYNLNAVPLNNLTQTGYTDDRGDISFVMMADTEYHLNFTKAGYNFQDKNIVPHADNYIIFADNTGSLFVQNGTQPSASVTFTTQYTRINQTTAIIWLNYTDATDATTGGVLQLLKQNTSFNNVTTY